ncbi:MAG: hypothetical protein RLZZ524_1974 [Pseudomonadota bacterium]|jgi:hypothetical protein
MARQHSPLQQIKEAKQIAKDHGLKVVECPVALGKTDYVVYRTLPDGRRTRLGKRSSPAGIRKYVADLAEFH